ncbi:MAG: phosphotransferase [Brachybacterium sp.]|nr:phosphotransferase [Brachybacterium sp.]
MRRNSYALAALTAASVPGLTPERTVPIATPEEDVDVAGIIASDGRRVTITCPATPAAGLHLEKDVHLADALAGTELAPLVPAILGFAPVPEGGRAVVAEVPRGVPLMFDVLAERAEVARSLGTVLARIHSLPRFMAEGAGAEEFTAATIRAEHVTRMRRLRDADELPDPVAQRWTMLLGDPQLWTFEPVFVHGSLSEENLFRDHEEISAVLGWSDARIADPASDLAWLVSTLDPEQFDALFAAYSATLTTPPHPRLLERAQLVGEFAVAQWLLHGLEVGDQVIIDEGRGMLEDLSADIAQTARDEAEQEYEALDGRRAQPVRRAPTEDDPDPA